MFWTCLFLLGGSIAAWVGMHHYLALDVVNTLLSPPFGTGKAFGVNADPRIYIEKCTNDTGTRFSFRINNSDGYAISYLCPITKNQCEDYVCTTNGTCQLVLVAGAACSEDSECYNTYGPDYRCNPANCSCVQGKKCQLDADCPVIDSPCSTFTCNASGSCVQTLNTGASCYSSDQCLVDTDNQFYYCNQTSCQCDFEEPDRSNVSCLTDANCPIPMSPCSRYACVNNTCVEALVTNATCAYSEECNDAGLACSWTTCQCEDFPKNTAIQCALDSDCPSLLNSCNAYFCAGGSCVKQLVGNATCSADSQCEAVNGTAYYCNTNTCTCKPRTPVVPSVMFLSTQDTTAIGPTTAVEFQSSTAQSGTVFYSHAAAPWDTLTFPDTTNVTGDYYLTWFYVYFRGNQSTPDTCSLYMTSASFANDTISVPGCKAIRDVVNLSTKREIYQMRGYCMFPGYPYGSSGLKIIASDPGSNANIGNFGYEALTGEWIIQKIS